MIELNMEPMNNGNLLSAIQCHLAVILQLSTCKLALFWIVSNAGTLKVSNSHL
jgi:hypothetical protein